MAVPGLALVTSEKDEVKMCAVKDCKQINPQPISEFSKHKGSKDGRRGECNTCKRQQWQEWAKQNPEKSAFRYKEWYKTGGRDYFYRTKYGITLEQYNDLFAAQSGCCAICERHQTELKNRLAVDHDHKTNEVRGLLCMDCNTAVGKFKDSTELLLKAVEYIRGEN